MIRKFFSIAFLFSMICFKSNAQNPVFDNLSIEAGYGLALPVSPSENLSLSDYTSAVNVQGALGYKINNLWGVRGSLAYHQFRNSDHNEMGVDFYKVVLEATFNITQALNTAPFEGSNPFDVFAHAGIGGTFASTELSDGTNKMGNLQIGVQPTYHLNGGLSVFLDAIYVANFNQAYRYDGLGIGSGTTTGGYFTALVGLKYDFGR